MIQYILKENDRYSIAEQAQMAIEGGCGWINLHLPGLDEPALRDALAPEVVDMCRDAGVFLTIDDRPETARELGLHGVRYTSAGIPSASSPAQLREEMGPEAIIGIETADPSSTPAMAAADIDFVCMPAHFDSAQRRRFTETVRSLGVMLPIVAQGDVTADTIKDFLTEGASGVAVSDFITTADDPVAAMAALLDKIAQ